MEDVMKDLNKLTPDDINTDADHGFDIRITTLEGKVDDLEEAAESNG